MEIENLIRYPALAVGLMEIENLIRYTARAVGLKPPAMRGEARLRGLWRIISSKTIRPRLCEAKPACAGYTGLFLQRPYALGYARRSPPARAMADYFFKDHTPSAIQGEARLRGLWRIISSKTIRPRLSRAKPACAGYGGLFLQRPYALGHPGRSPPARTRADAEYNRRKTPCSRRLGGEFLQGSHFFLGAGFNSSIVRASFFLTSITSTRASLPSR